MRILSLSLFHKFVEIRTCGLQRKSGVFWLKLVSVLVLKIVIVLKNCFITVCSWKKQKSFCCLPTQDQRDLVQSKGPAVEFAAQSAVQQCNPFHNEHVALTLQKGFAPS